MFEHVLEVRPQDMDAAGHLNHVAILGFFEHGRVRAHRDVRAASPELPDMTTVVRRIVVDYLAQAPLFEALTVRSWIARDGRTSRTWHQELVRQDRTVVARAEVVSVLVDPGTGRPQALPAVYRESFARFRREG